LSRFFTHSAGGDAAGREKEGTPAGVKGERRQTLTVGTFSFFYIASHLFSAYRQPLILCIPPATYLFLTHHCRSQFELSLTGDREKIFLRAET
jgi:hypothetical protein